MSKKVIVGPNALAPQHLSGLLHPNTPARTSSPQTLACSLFSTPDSITLRGFRVSTQTLLIALMDNTTCLDMFEKLLKHHLFTTAYNRSSLCIPGGHTSLGRVLFVCLSVVFILLCKEYLALVKGSIYIHTIFLN